MRANQKNSSPRLRFQKEKSVLFWWKWHLGWHLKEGRRQPGPQLRDLSSCKEIMAGSFTEQLNQVSALCTSMFLFVLSFIVCHKSIIIWLYYLIVFYLAINPFSSHGYKKNQKYIFNEKLSIEYYLLSWFWSAEWLNKMIALIKWKLEDRNPWKIIYFKT